MIFRKIHFVVWAEPPSLPDLALFEASHIFEQPLGAAHASAAGSFDLVDLFKVGICHIK